jgi:hypothetical protein
MPKLSDFLAELADDICNFEPDTLEPYGTALHDSLMEAQQHAQECRQ